MMTLHDNYFEIFKYADDINGLSGSFHENYDESGYFVEASKLDQCSMSRSLVNNVGNKQVNLFQTKR